MLRALLFQELTTVLISKATIQLLHKGLLVNWCTDLLPGASEAGCTVPALSLTIFNSCNTLSQLGCTLCGPVGVHSNDCNRVGSACAPGLRHMPGWKCQATRLGDGGTWQKWGGVGTLP